MTRVPAAARVGLLALCVPLFLGACSGDDGKPSAGATTPVATNAPAGPQPPVDTATPSAASTTLPPKKVGQAAAIDKGLQVSVTKVSEKDLAASGPGEIAGAGVVVHVEVKNETGKDFDLTALAVNASYAKGTPASPTDAENSPGLSGTVKAGASKAADYAFRVPKKDAKTLKVDITSSTSTNIVIFRR
jgi:hypothetical protein